MFQESEVVNLVLALLITGLFVFFSRGYRRPRFPFLYAGFFCMLLTYVFTVAEGLIFPAGCVKLASKRWNAHG